MNVRAAFVRRLTGHHGVIHDIAGLMHEVGRLRRVRFRRLLDHAGLNVQKR
jgi:hypothetical protein